MKKFTLLLLMAMSFATVFTSCGDDEEDVKPPVVVAPVLVKDYTATLLLPPLGGNTSETFFSTSNGKKYTFTTAAAGSNSDSVDFGYYYSSVFGASFMSPSNYVPDAEWNAVLGTWKSKNATTFKSYSAGSLTAFEGVTRNGQLDTIYNNASDVAAVGGSGVAGQRIGDLATGQVFIINTAGNKKALIYVNGITPGNGALGNITIRVKSQR